ncbi:hypothetical protein J7435_15845, partial [Xanthomonas phaseoli pv. dieffenbachiae]|uniref:hypothetical protein n=1 Tax=Xanthomonas phaseoli TaxID=1985254 RepID=UPI001AD9B71E
AGELTVSSSGASRFDLWLQRISLITQPMLLITTLITIKMTVIPLYEKAQLDENLARREIELKRATHSLSRIYAQARFYIAKQFSINAHYQCLTYKSEIEWIKTTLGENHMDPKKIRLEKLTYDVGSCVKSLAETDEAIRELNSSDQKTLRESIEEFGRSAKLLQARSLQKWNSAPSLARADPKKYINDAPTRKRLDALLVQLGIPIPERDEVADATTDLQTSIAAEYSRDLFELGMTQLQPWKAPFSSPKDQSSSKQ